MKALPLIALVLGAAFLFARQRSAHSMTNRITTLETRVEAAEAASLRHTGGMDGDDSSAASKTAREGAAAGDTTAGPMTIDDIDLAALAESVQNQTPGRMPNIKEMVRIQTCLLEASAEDVATLVARVAELEVPDEAKKSMIAQFVQVLAQKDPQVALKMAFESPYMDINENSWAFTTGFTGWMKEEPGTALAWFDEQVAAGTFEAKSLDGKSRTRLQFEATALSVLLKSDPAAALARMESLPEKHRHEVFSSGHLVRLDKETEPAFAELVRETLPKDQQVGAYHSITNNLVTRHGYERVGEFMENIAATPEERRAIASHAANGKLQRMGWEKKMPSAEELGDLQSFLREEAPESANAMTGEALASLAQGQKQFEQVVGLVQDVHAEDPSDDLLVGFLQQTHYMRDKETARELAEQIEDPAKREAVLKKLQN